MVSTYVKKRSKCNVVEVVLQKAVGAVQERRFSLRVVASRHGMTIQQCITEFKKIKNGDKCN